MKHEIAGGRKKCRNAISFKLPWCFKSNMCSKSALRNCYYTWAVKERMTSSLKFVVKLTGSA